MISTDGNASFAIFAYNNLPLRSTFGLATGFDSGSSAGVSYTEFLIQNDQRLETTNIFRIDGMKLSLHVAM